MESFSQYLSIAAYFLLLISWVVFLGVFFVGRKPAAAPDARRAPQSFAGIALQAVAVAIVWMFYRSPFLSPLIEGPIVLNIVLEVIAICLMIGAILFARAAVRELGKQFALQARLIEGHELITTGVYGVVRHPIYTAFFAMMLATALVMSHWIALVAGACTFLLGTRIRTSSEDRLLSEAFGEEFAAWKARVPALIPFAKW
ncbi:MAG: isoprenylcysteine carboxylmethyltransferase family protein [Acidobacteria bacterium]|nr:isoprenylcysteine carboxylmethyltransferase family protein [Acidobacteriota bacterium]